MHFLCHALGKSISQSHVFQTNEGTICHHLLRIVVSVVSALYVFAPHLFNQGLRGKHRHISAEFITRIQPTITIARGENVEIGKRRIESGIQTKLIACLHGEEHREFPLLPRESIGKSTSDLWFDGTMIAQISLIILRVGEICSCNVGVFTRVGGITSKMERRQSVDV